MLAHIRGHNDQTMSIATPVWVGFGSALGVMVLVWAGFRLPRAWRDYRERELFRRLLKLTPRVLRNTILPDGVGGSIHADYLVLTPCALHWISVFQVSGSVFGSHNMAEWTVINSDQRWTFANPLASLPQKSAAMQALIGDSIPLSLDWLFVRDATFPKGRVQGVRLLPELLEQIESEVRSGRSEPQGWQERWEKLVGVSVGAESQPIARA